jgi:multidrug efflux pump subunit AcrA (membrane-fusion protein)
MPGRTFEALVGEIAVVAQDKNAALSSLALRRSGEAFVNVVQVKLNFINMPEDARRQVRVGFTADVFIQTSDKSLALSVPWKAIQYDASGAPYAEVLTEDGVERRALKIGRANSSHAEVLQGLSDRDIVRNLNGSPKTTSNSSSDSQHALPGGS